MIAYRSSLLGLVVATSCLPFGRGPAPARWDARLPPPRLAADQTTVDTIARGVLHRAFLVRQGPWAIHVLDVDRRACWTPIAVKAEGGAIGRATTSQLMTAISPRHGGAANVAGAVNADFFLFEPAGVPVGAMVHEGRLVTGPVDRPVFADDSTGRSWLGTLRVEGRVVSGVESVPIDAWNRATPAGLSWYDESYGAQLDTATSVLRIVLSRARAGEIVAIDTTPGPTVIPRGGGVLVLGRTAPRELRARLLILATGRRMVDVSVRLTPRHPKEAVGGFPVLVRDSAEVAGLDSAGATTFAPVRHPRTVVALGAGGRRLFLITVDGRQPDHSAGMTLRELARLSLALGATEALNLDGGGSTTMIVARRVGDSYRHQVVNRPSDAQGERAVGNALAIVAGGPGCRR